MTIKIYLLLLSLIFSQLTIHASLKKLPVVLQGTIRFPIGISSHGVKIYQRGTIIPVEIEDNSINFPIKTIRNNTVFYILIANAQDIEYAFAKKTNGQLEQQTVAYRTILEGKKYKLYRIRIMPKETSVQNALLALDKKEKEQSYTWYIESLHFNPNDIIPDETIVVLYNPDYIQGLQNEGIHKLPTIIINPDIENDTLLYEQELINLLASLDTDTIHAPTKRKMVVNNACKRIIDYIG